MLRLLSLIVFYSFFIAFVANCQNEEGKFNLIDTTDLDNPAKNKAAIEKMDFEKPLNFFTSAGVGYRLTTLYDLSISPIDYTIQVEPVYPINTRFSLGLVWNPFKSLKVNSTKLEKYNTMKKFNEFYEARREMIAIALLLNVVQLSYNADGTDISSPIDVGFGIGIRSDNFMCIGTIEFTPLLTPRQYIIDTFKDAEVPLTLVPAGSSEPLKAINKEDKSIYTTKIHPFIGIKMAYAFSNRNNKSAPNK